MQKLLDNETVIEAGTSGKRYWRDLWAYRELLLFLSWRDILVRYKQTVVGVAWSVLRPLTTMVVFTVLFGKLAGFPTEGQAPYPIMVFVAMLPWQMFASALTESSNSLLANSSMISKVYFPRLLVPASTVVVSLVDFLISCAVLGLMMVWYMFCPGWRIFTLPLFVVIALMASLGAGFWLSALSVKYRDFRYVVPFMVQMGLYISPVGFSSTVIPEKWRLLYSLNPMVGVIDGFRWAVLGGSSELYIPGLVASCLLTLVLFCGGIYYFRRTEKVMADVI
jgi:lipopolysaccharide transport system permease protein